MSPRHEITLAPLFPAPLRYAHPSAVVALRLALLIANFVGVFSVTIHSAGFAMPAGGAVAAGHVSCFTECYKVQHDATLTREKCYKAQHGATGAKKSSRRAVDRSARFSNIPFSGGPEGRARSVAWMLENCGQLFSPAVRIIL